MSLRSLLDVVVSEIRQPTTRIREYALVSREGRALPGWDAGAHIEVHGGDAHTGPLVRHYSLLGSTGGDLTHNDPSHCYRIAVQREGRGGGSDHLHAHLAVGSALRISAPQNQFALERHDAHALLVAGGIGVTPIHAMTRSLLRRRRSFSVFYVGRHADEMAYRAQLFALAGARLHCHATSTAGRPDIGALLTTQPKGTRVYACGPLGLIDAIEQAAQRLGWARDRVRSERFGIGACADDRPFDVALQQSGRTLRVGAGQSILDVLIAARVDVLADCRRGECGLCAQTVLQADGPLDHRDVYLTGDDRAQGRSICICVSRMQGERLVLDL
jgi:dimethylamine monooxygenase subunit B